MAPMITICGLPWAFNRSANALQIGLKRMADMAGKNKCFRNWLLPALLMGVRVLPLEPD